MTGRELRDYRTQHKQSRRVFGECFGYSGRTIEQWEYRWKDRSIPTDAAMHIAFGLTCFERSMKG